MGIADFIIRKQREEFEKMTQDRYGEYTFPPDVLRIPNIRYNTAHEECRLDVYRMDDSTKTLPVIINVHGGGLIMGNKEFNTYFCAQLAKLGFVVFSVEYRKVPEVKAYDMWDDVSRAMDFVYENAKVFGGNPDKAFMVGDSAGAYLIVYAIALQKNMRLFRAANVKPSRLKVKATALISGMFYTARIDPVGLLLAKKLYGKRFRSRAIARFTNPSYSGIAKNMPPSFLVSSYNDELLRYSEDFSDALSNSKVVNKLVVYPEGDDLGHAFSVFNPELKESRLVIKGIMDFFHKYMSGE